MNCELTAAVKRKAYKMGADLVGIANIERWANCPLMMSPAGILPTARSVVVMAIHHGDGNVEYGGERHPQEIGPYAIQGTMNELLDSLSYRIGRFIEDRGHQSVPITASNMWRYRAYKELDAVFSPDMSHIYAAVAAGLAELGYSGLAMTPEFGPRNRFVSVITDAELEPTPLLPGDTLCDRCMVCVKKCPSRALDLEVAGEVAIEIEGHTYARADKNLWRCSWGEHFGLDLDLPKPDVVDEKVLLDTIETHGIRGGEMGQCLKHCLPPDLRSRDAERTTSPRRKRFSADASAAMPRGVPDRIVSRILDSGADAVAALSAKQCHRIGLDIESLVPGAAAALLIGCAPAAGNAPPNAGNADLAWSAQHLAAREAYFAAKQFEAAGYEAASFPRLTEQAGRHLADALGGPVQKGAYVVTTAPLTDHQSLCPPQAAGLPVPDDLTARIKREALDSGADLVGIAPAGRVDELAGQLREIFDGETVFDAHSKAGMFQHYDPQVSSRRRSVLTSKDCLPGARSVIVLGNRISAAAAGRMGQPPAEAIGPYAFAMYQSQRELQLVARRLMRKLRGMGFRCAASHDLLGTGSLSCNARGEQPDGFCNRFAAVCGGLGTLGKGGFVLTPRFGPNVRFLTIVTDAPLEADAVMPAGELRAHCDGCRACLDACSISAHRQPATVRLEDEEFSFHPVRQACCDWAKRFTLVAEEGAKYVGSDLTILPPETITAEALADGLRQLDPITYPRFCTAPGCQIACPLQGRSAPPGR